MQFHANPKIFHPLVRCCRRDICRASPLVGSFSCAATCTRGMVPPRRRCIGRACLVRISRTGDVDMWVLTSAMMTREYIFSCGLQNIVHK